MKARLIAVGERAPRWVAEGFEDYRKRLSHWLPLELVEVEPGVRLLARTTRKVEPTAEGEDYCRRALEIIAAVEDADAAVAAGVPTIAVPHVVPVPLTRGAVQLPSLRGLSPEDLVSVVADERLARDARVENESPRVGG